MARWFPCVRNLLICILWAPCLPGSLANLLQSKLQGTLFTEACPEPLQLPPHSQPCPSSLLTGALSSILSCALCVLGHHHYNRLSRAAEPTCLSSSVALTNPRWTVFTGHLLCACHIIPMGHPLRLSVDCVSPLF